MFSIRLLCILFMVASSGSAQSFLDWLGLRPGPHAVGFRAIAAKDSTRAFGDPKDLLGRPRPSHAYRPIQITVWYPASPQSEPTHMIYGDYVALTEWELGPEKTTESGRAAALQVFIQRGEPAPSQEMQAAFDRLFAEHVWAIRDAKPTPGKHPVVLLGPGGGSPSFDNSVMAEYLASHGYVVLSCPSVGTESRMPVWEANGIGDAEAMDTCTRDLEFLTGHAQALPMADPERIGTTGFSWGGITNVLLALKDSRIKAVISLDDAMDRRDLAAARRFPQFQPARLRVPFMLVVSGTGARNPESDFSFFEQTLHAETWKAVFPALEHVDFCAMYGLLGRRTDTENRNWPALQSGYEAVCRLNLRFFDAHLKGDAGARKALFLEAPEVCSVSVRPAQPALPRPAQFKEILEQDSPTRALELFRTLRKGNATFIPCREVDIRLAGLRLLGSGATAEGIAAFTLATEAFPEFYPNFEHLAEAYLTLGEFTQAETACIDAKTRLARDPKADKAARAQAEAALEQLAARIAARRKVR